MRDLLHDPLSSLGGGGHQLSDSERTAPSGRPQRPIAGLTRFQDDPPASSPPLADKGKYTGVQCAGPNLDYTGPPLTEGPPTINTVYAP